MTWLLLLLSQCDMVSSRLIAMEKTDEWAEAHGVQSSVVEVSAKNDDNVRAIFRKLFDQARRSVPAAGSTSRVDAAPPAAASHGSPGPAGGGGVRAVDDPLLKRHFSANAARMSAKRAAGSTTAAGGGGTGVSLLTVAGGNDTDAAADKPISRSRSLIRRMRKPKVKDSSELATNDCVIC